MPNCVAVKLEDIWAAEQEILDVIHKVCTENNLRYSLAYGTLLGAVRHKGFIPWDDDIDIMMPREDYDKLLEIWEKTAPSGFVLQNENTNEDYTNNFAKVRKDKTTFLQSEKDKTKSFHKGFFVDIFPCDRVACGRIGRKLQYAAFAVNLLFNRGHVSGTKGAIGFAERLLLKLVRKKRYRKVSALAGRFSRRWNKTTDTAYVLPNIIRACKMYYPADVFDAVEPVLFNEKEYCAVKDWDTVLKIEYGDYMQLPPEEERVWTHHPILIDFEHNYEDIADSK